MAAPNPAGPETAPESERRPGDRNVVVWQPGDGDRLWVFPTARDDLGTGGEFHIYTDPATQPEAAASFARFGLGAGGDLAEHRHERSEEFGYLISGEGALKRREGDVLVELPIRPGTTWYVPPGAWHALRNTATVPLVMVFATVPNLETGLLSFFRRIGTLPGDPPKALSKEEVAAIGVRHDFLLRGAVVPAGTAAERPSTAKRVTPPAGRE
jgi:mannose-6-phosphate isomerase-like protein (cupin superfamily)